MTKRTMGELDCSGDLNVVDGLEAVRLLRPGRSAATDIAHALRRPITTREAEDSAGQYTRSDLRWIFSKSECPVGPAPGDALLDGQDGRWTVLSVANHHARGLWECVCRDLAIAHGLDDAITVEQAVYAKGLGGAMTVNWHTWRTGVRARIQPESTTVEVQQQGPRSVQRCRIVLAENLVVDHTHRIRAADGAIYRIVRSTAADRIGQLQVIEAEQW